MGHFCVHCARHPQRHGARLRTGQPRQGRHQPLGQQVSWGTRILHQLVQADGICSNLKTCTSHVVTSGGRDVTIGFIQSVDHPHRRKLLTLRGFLGFGGNGGYFWTVTLLPLNDAVVLTFLAPAWVAILSPLLLRERPGKFTWFAIPVRPLFDTCDSMLAIVPSGLRSINNWACSAVNMQCLCVAFTVHECMSSASCRDFTGVHPGGVPYCEARDGDGLA